jgi:Ctr copper transporter family
MTFHFGYCEDVLFEAWKVRSVGSLIGSMIGIMILAALYEGLKYYRYAMQCLIPNSVLKLKNLFVVAGSTSSGSQTTQFSTDQ